MLKITVPVDHEPARIDIDIPVPPPAPEPADEGTPEEKGPPGVPIIVPNELPADKDPLGGARRILSWI